MNEQVKSDYLCSLEAIEEATHKGVTIGQLRAMIVLANVGEKGITIGELAESIGYQQGSASRLIQKMGYCQPKQGVGGWGLVYVGFDEDRPKHKIIKLTTKGSKLVSNLLKKVEYREPPGSSLKIQSRFVKLTQNYADNRT